MPRTPVLAPGKLPPELLAPLLERFPAHRDVLVGPGVGRDVAVVDVGGDRCWLLTADPITFATDRIGAYAVTVNVNDVAVAGGEPRFFLATVLLPEGATRASDVEQVFGQIRDACARYGVAWVGGHTEVTLGLDRVVVSGSLVGEVRRDELVESAGTRPGDAILCAGQLPLEGCAILARERAGVLRAAGVPEGSLRRCSAILDEPGLCVLPAARAVRAAALPHAMHDPTEGGIATALWELAEAAGVGIRVDGDALPWHPDGRLLPEALGLDPLGLIASGALLVAVEPGRAEAAIRACAEAGIPCVRVATALADPAQRLLCEGDVARPLPRFDADELSRALASG
jgi:hydrogenase expression/formation protein HypE